MSLIHEYGQRKEEKGIEKGMKTVIQKLYDSGMGIPEIASKLDIDVSKITEMINAK